MPHLDDGLLHALVDGEVPSPELGEIQAHLDQCTECRSRLEDARATAGASSELIELIEVPARATGRPSAPGHRARRWIRPVVLAASLILAVGLGYAGGVRSIPRPMERAMLEVERAPVDPVLVPVDPGLARDRATPAPPDTQPRPRSTAPALPPADQPADTAEEPPEHPSGREAAKAAGRRDTTTPPRRLGEIPLRLDEMVVMGTPAEQRRSLSANAVSRTDSAARQRQAARAAEAPTPAAPAPQQEVAAAMVASEPITFLEAVTRLGGQLRLIDGLVPNRLESIGRAVRVIYLLPGGELVLEQRREADSIAVALTAPWLSADSVAKLRLRIR